MTIPLSVEKIVIWVCGYPSCVEAIVVEFWFCVYPSKCRGDCDLVCGYPSCEEVIVIVVWLV